MPNRICLVSVDVEHPIDSLRQILEIFKKNNISATLFVTGKVLEQHHYLFKDLPSAHEIACHSFTHRFWNILSDKEREKELEDFIFLYQNIFNKKPVGFRAPSHIIDREAMELLEEKGFLYDSSIVPHYPPFKKYRGYKGRFPLAPYHPLGDSKFLEIPASGQLLGIPLAGAWITKLPLILYKILFLFYRPGFITFSIHSWDKLKNFEKIIQLLKNNNYQFLNGAEIYQNYK